MIQKLEQYNRILEDVIDTLKSLSTSGGPHENTLLLVMGDHGQTLNGDHGGGTAEEVETSLFAWSPKTPPNAVLSVLGKNLCNADLVHFLILYVLLTNYDLSYLAMYGDNVMIRTKFSNNYN
jgi:phosphatidylinositol glycan class O